MRRYSIQSGSSLDNIQASGTTNNTHPKRHSILSNLAIYSGMDDVDTENINLINDNDELEGEDGEDSNPSGSGGGNESSETNDSSGTNYSSGTNDSSRSNGSIDSMHSSNTTDHAHGVEEDVTVKRGEDVSFVLPCVTTSVSQGSGVEGVPSITISSGETQLKDTDRDINSEKEDKKKIDLSGNGLDHLEKPVFKKINFSTRYHGNSKLNTMENETRELRISPKRKRSLGQAHIDNSGDNESEHETHKKQALDKTDNRRNSDQLASVPPQFLEKLMNFSLFQNAPKTFYVAIARQLKLVIYHAQEYILKYGADARSMYWILRGSVKVTSPDGEIIHATLHEGAYFGEIGILFNRPRTATVIAETKVLVGVLTAENLNQVLPEFPIIERHIRDEAQERLAMQEQKRKAGFSNTFKKYKGSSLKDKVNLVANDNDSINALITNNNSDNNKNNSKSSQNDEKSGNNKEDDQFSDLQVTQDVFPQQSLHTVHNSLANHHDTVSGTGLGTFAMTSFSTADGIYEDSISTRQFLKSVPLFTTLPVDIIHGLALSVELRKYDPCEYILRKDEVGTDIFFLVSGEVEVLGNASIIPPVSTTGLPENQLFADPNIEILLGRIGPGQYFGEMSFLQSIMEDNKQPTRSADIRTISTCHILVLTGETLKRFCDEYPLIKREIIKTAEERIMKNKRKSTSLTSAHDHIGPVPTIPTSPVIPNMETRDTVATLNQQVPHQDEPVMAHPKPKHRNQYISHLLADSNFPAPNFSSQLEESRSPSPLNVDLPSKSLSPTFSSVSNIKPHVKLVAEVRAPYQQSMETLQVGQQPQVSQQWPPVAQQPLPLPVQSNMFNTKFSFNSSAKTGNLLGGHQIENEVHHDPHAIPAHQAHMGVQGFNSNFGFSGPMGAPAVNSHQVRRQSVSPSFPQPQSAGQSTTWSNHNSSSKFNNALSASSSTRKPVPPLDLDPPSTKASFNVRRGFGLSQPAQVAYMPRHARVRLSSIASRRRSSVLSVGPLPDRILLHCFEFLSLPELMKLRLVCRRWRQLLYVAPHLFNKLDLTPWKNSIDDKSLTHITNFVGSRPKKIDISNCYHITDEGFSYMINEIGIGGQLLDIKMVGCWEISAMAIMDIAVPSIGKNILEMDLSNCKKVQDDVVQRLLGWKVEGGSQVLPNYARPEMFLDPAGHNSQGQIFGEASLLGEEYENPLQTKNNIGCPNLHKLVLRHCKGVTDLSLKHISQYAFDRLTHLDFTRCTGITDKGFQFWKNNRVVLPNLQALVLSECVFLTDEAIFNITSSCPNLRVLNISFCFSITDAGLDVICFGLPYLEYLDVSFCGRAVSNASLLSVSVHLRHLQRILLKGCLRVTRSGVDSLLSGFAPLTFLDISQCKNAHLYQNGVIAERFQTLEEGGKVALIKVESNG